MSSSAITGPVLSDVSRSQSGTAAAPSWSFVNSTATGMYLVSSNVLGITTAGAQRMVVDASGNVGIGTTPNAWGGNLFKALHIGGGGSNLSATSGVDEQLQLCSNNYYDGSAYKYVISAHASRYVQNNSAHSWDIAPSGTAGNNVPFTTAMTLDASGSLLVGTTSGTIGGKVEIGTTTNSQVGYGYYYNAAAPSASGFYVNSPQAGTNTSNWYAFYCRAAGGDRFTVFGNGDVRNATGVFAAYSDLKIKENINDTAGKLEDICKLRVVNYTLKEDETKKKMIGLIAQEVEQVFPGLVDDMQDRGEKGEILESTTKSVKYSLLVPMLVKAVQEQQEIIGKLEARLAALESK
jgi:hypothetical protein